MEERQENSGKRCEECANPKADNAQPEMEDECCNDSRCHHQTIKAHVDKALKKLTDHKDRNKKEHFHHLRTPEENAWMNWNNNQKCRPMRVEHPNNLDHLIEIVKGSEKVRVAGYGHSWSPIVATEEDSEITLIDLKACLPMKNILSEPEEVSRLKSVTFQCAVSVQELEDWVRSNEIKLTLPCNVVLTEVFLVGLTQAVCHGAGYPWGTVSDFVQAVTIIDADGILKTYTDHDPSKISLPQSVRDRAETVRVSEEEMNHLRGSFGLMGVIYCMTIALVDADVLTMKDRCLPVSVLRDPTQLKQLVERYNGWLEIFWVPFNDHCWVKSWEKSAEGTEAQTPHHHVADEVLGKAGKTMYRLRPLRILKHDFRKKGARKFAAMIFKMMTAEFRDKPLVHHYHRYDATHYRDYIDSFPVEDTEYSLPVDDNYTTPSKAFSLIQDVIQEMEDKYELYPINLTCEMRFTGGTGVTLSQHPKEVSKKWVHIEFLRSSLTGVKEPIYSQTWDEAVEKITTEWTKLGGLPHWAKGWQKIPGIDNFLKEKVIKDSFRDYRLKMDPNGKFLSKKFTQLMEYPEGRGPSNRQNPAAFVESDQSNGTFAQTPSSEGATAGIRSIHGTQMEVLQSLEDLKKRGEIVHTEIQSIPIV
eukprot:TRINITY_DN5827_c0_g1_i3.p1 TRINITY_DN5827_c0_g1~~TRINITY_DN5827_c0_g1_i3.p1  ORF type:complete len:643 (-),score=148.31 TRINITY_DN5827_c0_g1_i3:81-2009(-)